jgi:hypothetical protein
MTTAIPNAAAKDYLLQERSAGDFQRNFERACFGFRHVLAGNPLFGIEAISECARQSPDLVYFDAGNIKVDDRWDQVPQRQCTAIDAIRNIHNAGAWVFLNHLERLPEYERVLDDVLREAEELSGSGFRKNARSREMIVFLTSPGRITPYHIDRECNFLLQTSGVKVVHTFDGNDRTILPEEEKERFWAFDKNGAKYKPANQEKAKSFAMRPGDAIHIPVNFPHWVENGPEVSISVSISVQFHDRVRADVYRANHLLRRMGLKPHAPGESVWRDAMKARAYAWSRGVREWRHRQAVVQNSR